MQNPNIHRPEPTAPKGHYVSRLTPEELTQLQTFNEWLKNYRTNSGKLMTDGGRASYRTYVTQSMVVLNHDGGTWKDLSTSQRSGWNLFCTYWDEVNDEEDTDEADEIDRIGDEDIEDLEDLEG
jgi:hypothetical protein